MPSSRDKSPDNLTPKERATLKLYTDPNSPTYLNATKSAHKVYSTSNLNSARSLGGRVVREKLPLIATTDISTDIREKLTPEWILTKLKDEVEVKAKRSSDRIKALELIGSFKDLSMWKQNISQETTITTPESENDLDKEFRELIAARESGSPGIDENTHA